MIVHKGRTPVRRAGRRMVHGAIICAVVGLFAACSGSTGGDGTLATSGHVSLRGRLHDVHCYPVDYIQAQGHMDAPGYGDVLVAAAGSTPGNDHEMGNELRLAYPDGHVVQYGRIAFAHYPLTVTRVEGVVHMHALLVAGFDQTRYQANNREVPGHPRRLVTVDATFACP